MEKKSVSERRKERAEVISMSNDTFIEKQFQQKNRTKKNNSLRDHYMHIAKQINN